MSGRGRDRIPCDHTLSLTRNYFTRAAALHVSDARIGIRLSDVTILELPYELLGRIKRVFFCVVTI